MKKLLYLLFVSISILSYSQLTVNAKLVKTDSLRGRLDTLNIINSSPYFVTVNDTLLTQYISNKAGTGSPSIGVVNTLNVSDGSGGWSGSTDIDVPSSGFLRGTGTLQLGSQGVTYVNVIDDLRPSSDNTYDLGTNTFSWADLWLEGDFFLQSPTVPSSASDTGTIGEISWDSDYIYICVATNTWKRVAIATW